MAAAIQIRITGTAEEQALVILPWAHLGTANLDGLTNAEIKTLAIQNMHAAIVRRARQYHREQARIVAEAAVQDPQIDLTP